MILTLIYYSSVKALVNEELECSLEISTSSTSTRIASFIRFSLLDSDDAIIRQSTTEVDDDTLNSDVLWRLKPGEVSLWWSVGKGAQPLYTVKVELLDVVSFTHVETAIDTYEDELFVW